MPAGRGWKDPEPFLFRRVGMKHRVHPRSRLERIPQPQRLPSADGKAMLAVSAILPFRVNHSFVDERIDGS
ncbi:MAG: hypothetical protein V3T64_01855, partial [Myxococcota bacterium]